MSNASTEPVSAVGKPDRSVWITFKKWSDPDKDWKVFTVNNLWSAADVRALVNWSRGVQTRQKYCTVIEPLVFNLVIGWSRTRLWYFLKSLSGFTSALVSSFSSSNFATSMTSGNGSCFPSHFYLLSGCGHGSCWLTGWIWPARDQTDGRSLQASIIHEIKRRIV